MAWLILVHTIAILMTPGLGSTQNEGSQFIPPDFPNQNISDYSLRYLSVNGTDAPGCLQSQPYPYSDDAEPCGTLRYALTGGYRHITDNGSNIILLVLPGRYAHGNVTIWMNNYRNIVVRKIPGFDLDDEVVFYCERFLQDDFNNFYFTRSEHIVLQELVFTKCGPRSPGMATKQVSNLLITNCVYR